MSQVLTHLSHTPVEQFMREDWHIRPRIFRQVFPGLAPLCDMETLHEMASDEDVESRLIQHHGGDWTLEHGPFDTLPDLQKPDWTVLIQGLDHHLPEAHDLLQKFRFIPDARLDDIMLSLASDGGGVGPHFDSYDVFLIQMQGLRRWKIGPLTDLSLVEDAPLKLLKNFEATQEFLLEPGDMLYLPPNYGHEGVAQGVCMTLSVGFRALNEAEVLSTLLRDLADQLEVDPHLKSSLFSDPARGVQKKPAEIPSDMVDFTTKLVQKLQWPAQQIQKSLGTLLTEPKPHVYFKNNTENMSVEEITQVLVDRGISLGMKTRMLVLEDWIFINGDAIRPKTEKTLKMLQNLANDRQIEPKLVKKFMADIEFRFFIIGFTQAGWVETIY